MEERRVALDEYDVLITEPTGLVVAYPNDALSHN